jgi:predicted Zn-dependent protease
MAAERLAQLQALLAEQPNDPFLLYAVAIEIVSKQPYEAGALFENLLKNHPNYLATYYMAAQYYAETNQNEKAEQTYKQGIELAQQQGELKTLAELKNAYQNWQLELD